MRGNAPGAEGTLQMLTPRSCPPRRARLSACDFHSPWISPLLAALPGRIFLAQKSEVRVTTGPGL